jgi:hypothetical protein
MIGGASRAIPADLIAELENRYFWWEPVGAQPRSETRIIAQAMDQASFAEVRRLETIVGPERLVEIMVKAEPGWFSDRSWELWRGRLSHATGRSIAAEPPRRSFHASEL